MGVQVWETLKEAITAYTGLSPPTFFTVVALGLVTYYVLSGLFASSSDGQTSSSSRDFEDLPPLPPPVQLGEITEQDLRLYDGSDPNKPLLMAIKAQIYDVSQSRVFYGPGGPYALFAGRDASRALAKMSFEEKDLTSDISGLGVFELEALQDWEYKFMSKYVKVGTIKKTVPLTDPAQPIQQAEASKPVDFTPNQTEALEEGEASKHVDFTPQEPEAAAPEGVLPVNSHAESTDGDKECTGTISITDNDKKE